VFFDALGIGWEYEPQGYVIKHHRADTPYLPDFRLEGGTWIEVKGSEAALNKPLLIAADQQLPGGGLLILGPIPEPRQTRYRVLAAYQLVGGVMAYQGDWGWRFAGEPHSRYGFGSWHKDRRLWFLDNAQVVSTDAPWISPVWDAYETNCAEAYAAARSARFEHNQSGPYGATS
jgi:hypothetical protein